METEPRSWTSYEEVAQYLLDLFSDHFGLDRVEGKQKVESKKRPGKSWEIDAKGFRADGSTFVIVECRRKTTRRVEQEEMAGLAYRITDTGAEVGIVVSPLGLQSGAESIADAEGIVSVILDPKSTTSDFILQWLNQIRCGLSDVYPTHEIQERLSIRVYQNGEEVASLDSDDGDGWRKAGQS